MEQQTDINPFDPDFGVQQNMDITFDNILDEFLLTNPTNAASPNQTLPAGQPILTTPHVIEDVKEAPQPKKRGRKPGSGRKPAASTQVKADPVEAETEPKEKKARKPRVAKAAPKKKAAKKLDDDSIFDDDSDEEMFNTENIDSKDEKTKK